MFSKTLHVVGISISKQRQQYKSKIKKPLYGIQSIKQRCTHACHGKNICLMVTRIPAYNPKVIEYYRLHIL